MKKIFFFAAVLSLVFSVGAQTSTQNQVQQDSKNKLRLMLPPQFYAVPGREMCFYFDNIILTTNIKNYAFDVDCLKGRQDETRWRITPAESDVGKFPLSLKVFNDENKVVAEGMTELVFVPKNAGENREISIIIIGDSLTDLFVYPNELKKLLDAPGNPKVKFIGSHGGLGKAPDATHVAHEGRGGWSWESYCTRWDEKKDEYNSKSPFLFKNEEGKTVLDFKKYLEKYNDGKAPDFITVFLGCNDNFGANDSTIDASLDRMCMFSDMLLGEIRKVCPDTKIGLIAPVPPAATQDAFGTNYQCTQTRWQYRRNQHKAVERVYRKYGNSEKENIYIIPAHMNLDCENNYPIVKESVNSRNTKISERLNNGVHPAESGYNQIADSLYCWLKYMLSSSK